MLVDQITPAPFQTAVWREAPPPSAEFHLAPTQPGRYALVARVKDRAIAVLGPFEVESGKLLSGIEIPIECGTRLEITVRDASGKPVEGARLWLGHGDLDASAGRRTFAEELARAAESGSRPVQSRGLITDAAGKIAFEHVPTQVPIWVHAAHASRLVGGSPALTLARQNPIKALELVLTR